MKQEIRNFFYILKHSFLVFGLLSVVCCLMSSCIRLTGNAGVWKKGADDEEPSSAVVGFDTNQMIPQKNNANIST